MLSTRDGEPFTKKLPPAKSMSSGAASSMCAAISRPSPSPSAANRQRGAADCARAGTVAPHPEGNAPGIAVHDLDVVDRAAEFLRHDLGEGGLVSLAVRVRTGQDGDLPGGMNAHDARLIQTGLCDPSDPTMCDGARPQASMYADMPMPMYVPFARPAACSARRAG